MNHPNIAIVHGLESVLIDSGQVRALVMELVDGPTLAELIGTLSVPEALRLARQIAEGLEAAHEQGIIHRDLKPANIKVRPDGAVKVLDFGLAKAAEPAGAISPGLSLSPTITSPAMTAAGLILGTAAYMSPEQAKGREADKRSDVWSFGAVLYEMLTARRAFDGDDVSDTMASVLKSEPDWSIVPADVPPAVVSLMKGCLVKDRRQRVSDISIAKFVIKDLSAMGVVGSAVVPVAPVAGRSRWAQALAIAIAVVSTALIVGIVMWRMQPVVPPVTVARFSLIPEGPFTSAVQQLVAISPDGNRIAYNAGGRLRIRSLSEMESRGITDADTIALNPAFSPDNTAIAFTSFSNAGLALRRVPAVGGTVTTVASFPSITNFSGISWSPGGILMGVTGAGGGILRVSGDGGTPERIVAVDGDQIAHGPQMLPDGRTVLFTLAKAVGDDRWDKAQIVAQSLARWHPTRAARGWFGWPVSRERPPSLCCRWNHLRRSVRCGDAHHQGICGTCHRRRAASRWRHERWCPTGCFSVGHADLPAGTCGGVLHRWNAHDRRRSQRSDTAEGTGWHLRASASFARRPSAGGEQERCRVTGHLDLRALGRRGDAALDVWRTEPVSNLVGGQPSSDLPVDSGPRNLVGSG